MSSNKRYVPLHMCDYPPEWDEPCIHDWSEDQDILDILKDDADCLLWQIALGNPQEVRTAVVSIQNRVEEAFNKALKQANEDAYEYDLD